MPNSMRRADRLTSIAIYAGFGILAIWVGAKLINHSIETKFYRDFLLRWRTAILAYNKEHGYWPSFSRGNHVEYMMHLCQKMYQKGMPPPRSNTSRAYVYRLDRLGDPDERIFLLCLPHRIVLYGLSPKTFNKMDRFTDGKKDPQRGALTGKASSDGETFVGALQL